MISLTVRLIVTRYCKVMSHQMVPTLMFRPKLKNTANKPVLCNVLKEAIMSDDCSSSIPHPEAFVKQTQQLNGAV